MSRTLSYLRALLIALVIALVIALGGAVLAPATAVAAPLEDYSSYQPQTKCSPKAKAGTVALGSWLVRRYGGGFGPISRACSEGTSEHQEGRAFDWMLDATSEADRQLAEAFLERAFREDKQGNGDAWARRMGIMYVIWNDEMYSAWDEFEPEPYLSSGCSSAAECSTTLRHRDHVHISLNRRGGRGLTSWYADRVPQD